MFDLRPHQEAAIAKMHNGCILCGGVGVGKSHTAVGYYLQNEAPKPVYVITTAKKRDKGDWQWLWGEIGMCGDDAVTLGSVVIVDSWNNIDKYKEVMDAFFIFDEQRLVGTGAWVKAFYKIAEGNRWIMLSATPGDNWLDYVPVFRANGFIHNITQFKEDHCIMRWTGRYYQLAGYRQVGKLVRWRNQLLVDMPYERHTVRHSHDVAVTYDKDLVRELVKKRWHVYENRPLTDASELFRVMRKVVYSDSSRLQAVRELLKTHPKLIVFYNFDYELEQLRSLAQPDPELEMLRAIAHSENEVPPREPSGKEIGWGNQKKSADSNDSQPSETLRTKAALDSTSFETGSPWDYLLSPEGMRENLRSLSESSGRYGRSGPPSSSSTRSTTKRSTTSTTMSDDGSRSLPSMPNETRETEECQNNSHPEKSSSNTSTDGRFQMPIGSGLRSSSPDTLMEPSTSTQGIRPSTGSGSKHSESLSQAERSSLTHESKSKSSSSPESPRELTQGSLPEATHDSTNPERPTKTLSDESSVANWSTRESSPTQTDISSHQNTQEETECPSQLSPTSSTRVSTSSEFRDDTLITKTDTSRVMGSPRKSTSNPSSQQSRPSQDHLSDGSGSTPSPQFQVAEWNGHRHEAVPTTTSWVYLVQYAAGAEAWECTDTDAMVFFSMPYSWKKWDQAHGRIDRMNTLFKDLYYYTLVSKSPIDRAVSRSLRAQKSFNESAFIGKMGWK